MRPYYQHAGVTIYHGDCREILPTLAKSEVLLTDPPYGIGLDCDYSKRANKVIAALRYPPLRHDTAPMDFRFLWSSATISVIFGANNFPQQLPFEPRRDGWIVWDKRTNEAADKILGSPFETAVVLGRRLYKIIRLLHCGVISHAHEKRIHPTQKPSELMARILTFFPHAQSVIDPFMGTGSTLVAAKNLGRTAIGIELEERYCEMAAEAVAQEVFEFDSFLEVH